MKRLIIALACASASFGLSAAEKPLPVTVANPVLPVEVRNADPIPVTNVGETRVPFMAGDSIGFGGAFTNFAYDIPAGKRLVIETVSVYAQFPPGTSLSVSMLTFLGSSGLSNGIPVESQGVSPESGVGILKEKFAGLHAVRMWADDKGGTADIQFSVARSLISGANETNNGIVVVVHGYLIDP